MRIYYVAKKDVLVVELGDLQESPGARRLGPGVFGDFTEDGKVLVLEINRASRHYAREELEALSAEQPSTITSGEAAALLGMTKRAVQLAIGRGEIAGKKAGRDWVTTATAVAAYMHGRAPGYPTRT